jgi:hypothetical protein
MLIDKIYDYKNTLEAGPIIPAVQEVDFGSRLTPPKKLVRPYFKEQTRHGSNSSYVGGIRRKISV